MNPRVKVAYERRWWIWHNVVLEIPAIKLWIREFTPSSPFYSVLTALPCQATGRAAIRSCLSTGYGNPRGGEETIVRGRACRRICRNGVRPCPAQGIGRGIRARPAEVHVCAKHLYILYPVNRGVLDAQMRMHT